MTNENGLPTRRDIRALFLAPLLPTGLLVLFDGIDRAISFGALYSVGALLLGIYVLIVMEFFALFLGYPLVVLLQKHLHSVLLCMGIGSLIAALPLILLSALGPLPDFASTNGVPTVFNGQRMAQWYVELAASVSTCLVFGALGGGIFWRLRRPEPNAEENESLRPQ